MSDEKNSVQPGIDASALKPQKRHWLLDAALSLGSALIFVFAVRSALIEAFKIPSGSMIPTLYIGDQLFVNKASYGIRVPFTDWIGDHPIYLVKFSPPRRGDVIVFKYPRDTSITFIKRIIGVPGDTIEMRNKVIFINGKALQRTPVSSEQVERIIKDLSDNPRYPGDRMLIQNEKFRDDDTGTIMIDQQSFYSENYPPTVVPADHYFCMGDNRDDSQDSRYWGFVPFDYIKGRAFIIWLSVWLDFDKATATFHPERIGTIIH